MACARPPPTVVLLILDIVADLTFRVVSLPYIPCNTQDNLHTFGQMSTRRTDHVLDHDLDHLDPNLPLGDAVQDLHGIDPTQEVP